MAVRSPVDNGILLGLAWLATAVAARPLRVQALIPRAAHRTRLGQSHTDGSTIFVDHALDADERRCVVIAHAMLLACGALAPPMMQALRHRPTPIRQAYFAAVLPWAARQHAHLVPALFVRRLALGAPAPGIDGPSSALERALTGAPVLPLPEWLGQLPQRIAVDATTTASAPGTPSREAAAADEATQAISDDDRRLLERLRSPVRGFGLADLLLHLLDYRRSAGEAVPHPNNSSEGRGTLAHAAGRPAARAALQALAARVARVVHGPPPAGTWYPEWDPRRGCYQACHACVTEVLPQLDAEAARAPTARRIPGLAKALASIGTVHQRLRGQARGADIDLDACIDFRARRRAGDNATAKLFIDTRRSRRDISALVLLDISSSTADLGADGHSALHTHRGIAEQLVRIFEHLGDRVALYAFHSRGRELVRFVRLKRFDERFAHCLPRLSALEPSGMTRMGAALRHATHLLASERRHHQRLLLLLTDGFSYDDGYEQERASEDTRRALLEAATRGIATACVQVGSEQDDAALAALYGEAAYLRCTDSVSLAHPLRVLIEGALARVDSRAAARSDSPSA